MPNVTQWAGPGRHSPFMRGVAAIAAGTAIGQAVTLASAPVLSRLYDPDAFGALAIFLSATLILTSVASLRYEIAIPLPTNDTAGADLLAVCVAVLAVSSAIVAILAAFFGGWFARVAGTPDLASFVWLFPVAVFAAGLYQALSNWALRRREFSLVARTRINQGVGQAAVQVGVGFLRNDPLGLLLGSVVGRAGGVGTLGLFLRRRDRDLIRQVSRASMRATARAYARFPLLSTPSGLLNSVGLQAPALVIGGFYGAQVVGWFALSQRVVAIPMTYLGTAVAQAYFAEAARLHRDREEGLQSLFFRSARSLALIGAVPALIVAIGGPRLFSVVFGSEWTEAGEYARVLSIMFFAQFVAVPLSQTLNVFEKLGVQAAYDFARLVLGVGALTAASLAGWSATRAILVYSLGMTVAYAVNFVLNALAVSRPDGPDRER